GAKGTALKDTGSTKESIRAVLKTLGKKDLEALIWTTVSWNAWINLNLDKPAALVQLSIPQACLERVMEIDAAYLHGLPYILMGVSLAARPQMFGGDIKQSRYYFDKVLELSHQKFLLGQYYFARYYAVRAQNKKLFFKLIQEIDDADPRGLKDVCLINAVMQKKAEELGKMADELFF
ncbi:MAG: TRAP transporter TatT component family protein, partial [Desulfatiglandales bacterium]